MTEATPSDSVIGSVVDFVEEAELFANVQDEGGGAREPHAENEVAEQFDVHPNQSQDWIKRLLGSAEEVFGGGASSAAHNELRSLCL